MGNTARFPILFCLMLLYFYPSALMRPETLREKVQRHFVTIDWSNPVTFLPAVEIPGVVIPGGNETFPVIGISANSGVKAIYPEIEELGSMDFRGIDADLILLAKNTAQGFQDKKIDETTCITNRPFIAPLVVFQLARLPSSRQVLFSRPMPASEGGFRIPFRIEFPGIDRFSYVFLKVHFVIENKVWKINEILFDGESYARLAQPN